MPKRNRQVRRPPLSRRIYFREPNQTFLIVCEGKNTEPLYFNSFKVPKDVKKVNAVGLGRNTVSLVKEAIKLKDKNDYDQVWVVFDVEDYVPLDVNAALALAKDNSIRVACSNEAFEIWFLLHFNYYNTAISRSQYPDLLTRNTGIEYDKGCDMYARLVPLQEQAIRNAKRLLAEYDPYDPSRCNPSTTVHKLVEELNRFTPESRS